MVDTLQDRISRYSYEGRLETLDCLPEYKNDTTYTELTKEELKDYRDILLKSYSRKSQLSDMDIEFYEWMVSEIGLNVPYSIHMLWTMSKDKFGYKKNKVRSINTKLEGYSGGSIDCLDSHKRTMYYKPFLGWIDWRDEHLYKHLLDRSQQLREHADIPDFHSENFYMITDVDYEFFKYVHK